MLIKEYDSSFARGSGSVKRKCTHAASQAGRAPTAIGTVERYEIKDARKSSIFASIQTRLYFAVLRQWGTDPGT